MVTRYICVTRSYEDADYGEMEPDADGSYVTSEDFDKVVSALEAVRGILSGRDDEEHVIALIDEVLAGKE